MVKCITYLRQTYWRSFIFIIMEGEKCKKLNFWKHLWELLRCFYKYELIFLKLFPVDQYWRDRNERNKQKRSKNAEWTWALSKKLQRKNYFWWYAQMVFFNNSFWISNHRLSFWSFMRLKFNLWKRNFRSSG